MKLAWSELARGDLLAIFHYIANDSVAAGAKVYSAIETKAEQLMDFPEIGRAGRVEGARELVVTGLPYIIAYAIQGDTVFILRVLHVAQQWPDNLPR